MFFDEDLNDNELDKRAIITVSELTRCIKMTLEADNIFSDLWVKGEVSNLKNHSNGHIYFSLKDGSALINCVIWSGTARSIKPDIVSGSSIIVHGRISLYDKQGQYQLTVDKIEKKGIGELYEAYEKLKAQLEAEGLFDTSHKIHLPDFPRKITMITSSTGAVLHDMVSIARKRFAAIDLLLIPTIVQGDAASASIVKSINIADRYTGADIIILARGGGSIEDLWCFNDESVVRAIYRCDTPIVSAVGHETDYTLSDLVADVRAATPSNAMEIALKDKNVLLAEINKWQNSITSLMKAVIKRKSSELNALIRSSSFRYPENMINERWQTLDLLQEKLSNSYNKMITAHDSKLSELSGRLNTLSPLNVLSRGYSVMKRDDGSIVKSINDISPDETVSSMVSDGIVVSRIIESKKGWNINDSK